MYILLESSSGPISNASIYEIDCIGTAANEEDALEWRNKNFDYRAYKYAPISKEPDAR